MLRKVFFAKFLFAAIITLRVYMCKFQNMVESLGKTRFKINLLKRKNIYITNLLQQDLSLSQYIPYENIYVKIKNKKSDLCLKNESNVTIALDKCQDTDEFLWKRTKTNTTSYTITSKSGYSINVKEELDSLNKTNLSLSFSPPSETNKEGWFIIDFMNDTNSFLISREKKTNVLECLEFTIEGKLFSNITKCDSTREQQGFQFILPDVEFNSEGWVNIIDKRTKKCLINMGENKNISESICGNSTSMIWQIVELDRDKNLFEIKSKLKDMLLANNIFDGNYNLLVAENRIGNKREKWILEYNGDKSAFTLTNLFDNNKIRNDLEDLLKNTLFVPKGIENQENTTYFIVTRLNSDLIKLDKNKAFLLKNSINGKCLVQLNQSIISMEICPSNENNDFLWKLNLNEDGTITLLTNDSSPRFFDIKDGILSLNNEKSDKDNQKWDILYSDQARNYMLKSVETNNCLSFSNVTLGLTQCSDIDKNQAFSFGEIIKSQIIPAMIGEKPGNKTGPVSAIISEISENKTIPITPVIPVIAENKTTPIIPVIAEKPQNKTANFAPLISISEKPDNKTIPIVTLINGKAENKTIPIIPVIKEKPENKTMPISPLIDEKSENKTTQIVPVIKKKNENKTIPIVPLISEKPENTTSSTNFSSEKFENKTKKSSNGKNTLSSETLPFDSINMPVLSLKNNTVILNTTSNNTTQKLKLPIS